MKRRRFRNFKCQKKDLLPRFQNPISNRGEGEGKGPMGLDLTCDRRAATVSGDGEWRRQPATELLERVWGRRLRSRRKSQISIETEVRFSFLLFFPFLVQEKICSSLRFDRD